MISVPDVYPTLLGLMGLGQKVPPEVEGTSYAGLLETGRGSRPTSQLYLRVPCDNPALGHRGVRTRKHTLVVQRKPGQEEKIALYDNVADPYQLKNIA